MTNPEIVQTSLEKDSLCDIDCEIYILSLHGIELEEESLMSSAQANYWLKDLEMPIHHVGRLLESQGMTVIQKSESSVSELRDFLRQMADVIAVINKEKLDNPDLEDCNPNHAVVVLDLNDKSGLVRIYDPASEPDKVICSLEVFENAWKDSNYYLAVATPANYDYTPNPIDLKNVILDQEFADLRESIAENAHENWALLREKAGWTYGPVRNDELKQTPDLVPYSRLLDSEKDYDRNMAMQTLKLVKKIGYDLIKRQDSEAYRILAYRMQNLTEEASVCSCCGRPIFKGQVYCDQCGRKLEDEDF